MTSELIQPANLEWHADQPYAPDFEDIYFSPDGRAEVQRVFIQPTHLDQQTCSRMNVAEVGFGTGLNFITLADDWRAQADKHLHFITFEAHPLCFDDWQKVAALHPQSELYRQLAAFPPPLIRGWHRRSFAQGRIRLSVFHGEAEAGVAELIARSSQPIHAWFLDGFAPARNPALWSPSLFQKIAATCGEGSQVATFTAAGHVRRGLAAVGFDMRRVDQRPHKRESLAGVFRPATGARSLEESPPVTIYGAGITGVMVARHLAENGHPCSVVDPLGIAGATSGMQQTLLHARLLGDQTPSAKLRSHAFHYATAYAEPWLGPAIGALQIQSPNLTAAKLERIANAYGAKDAQNNHWIEYQATPRIQARGIPDTTCLWFPTSRTLDLGAFCHALMDHPLIEFRTDPPQNPEIQVLCCATATRTFAGLDWLELADVAGQLDRVTFTAPAVTTPIVGSGYFLPLADGAVLGSTYEYQAWTPTEATAQNKAKNSAFLPADYEHHSYQRGVRSVSSDRIPLVGQVDAQRWLCTGMGSMGTTYAPLAAATIASTLCGEIPPVTAELARLMDPMRIAERQARRGVRHR